MHHDSKFCSWTLPHKSVLYYGSVANYLLENENTIHYNII
jgi:hypothetical protein